MERYCEKLNVFCTKKQKKTCFLWGAIKGALFMVTGYLLLSTGFSLLCN